MINQRPHDRRAFTILTAAMLGVVAPACATEPAPEPVAAQPTAVSSGGSTVYVQQPAAGTVYVQPGYGTAPTTYQQQQQPTYVAPARMGGDRMGGGYSSGSRMGGGYGTGSRMGGSRMKTR
jgi:hypothetical protein